ncbi:hypothetical protein PO124_25725 [Bacillus licheniformis]|nr:hypothetical protein [Bacillus licheniformis]
MLRFIIIATEQRRFAIIINRRYELNIKELLNDFGMTAFDGNQKRQLLILTAQCLSTFSGGL